MSHGLLPEATRYKHLFPCQSERKQREKEEEERCAEHWSTEETRRKMNWNSDVLLHDCMTPLTIFNNITYRFFIRAHIHQMICNWLINFETRMQRAVTCPRPARQKGSGSKKKRRRFVHSYPGWWFHTSHKYFENYLDCKVHYVCVHSVECWRWDWRSAGSANIQQKSWCTGLSVDSIDITGGTQEKGSKG